MRNPFEKVVSGFRFFERLERRGPWTMEVPKYPTVQERFAKWVETQVAPRKILSDRDRYMIQDKVCVDFFIRYEDLGAGVQPVCATI